MDSMVNIGVSAATAIFPDTFHHSSVLLFRAFLQLPRCVDVDWVSFAAVLLPSLQPLIPFPGSFFNETSK